MLNSSVTSEYWHRVKLKVKFKVLPFKWNAATGASVKLQLESCRWSSLKSGPEMVLVAMVAG
ncbi:ssDNA-binding protein [Enterobacter phage 01_vB_Eclo_IJM]|nr:ssDNA-binding protein [Enterobacter phage 01_vB_Eclo_IJM]